MDNGTTFTVLSTTEAWDTTTMTTNGTTVAPPGVSDLALGYIMAAVAVVFFGSNFIPVKKFEMGDGMFFQWVLCIAIWCAGLVVHAYRRFPPVYALPLLGGFLWCTGNIMTVPIIKAIGLGKGILVWGSFNLLSGWFSGTFGWFGLKPEKVENELLNYFGMGLCFFSAFIYLFVKSNVSQNQALVPEHPHDPEENDPLLPSPGPLYSVTESTVTLDLPDSTFLERMPPTRRKIVGTLMAVVAGLLYGLNFTPVVYAQEHYHGSQNGLDYVFAHFSGILATSTLYFVIYSAYMRNKPRLYPRVILPGIISGLMWAVADIGWFVANSSLSEAVSFPIITSGPGIISALWGVLLFREIQGKLNLLVLGFAMSVAITGAVLTGFSKV